MLQHALLRSLGGTFMSDITVQQVARRRGFLGLLGGVLIAPRVTFGYLREYGGRAWLGVAAILLILSALPPIVSGPIQGRQARELVIQQLESQPNMAGEINVEQAAAFATSPIFTTIVPTSGAIIGLLLGWLLWSGALYLLTSITGGRGSFSQMFQVIVWATVPYGIRSLLQTAYVSVTGNLVQNAGLSGFIQTAQATPGIYTPVRTELLVLSQLLGQIEIYLFWYLALLTIGLVVMVQLPRRKATGLVLTVWLVFLLLRLVGAAVSSSLSGGFMG
jgi:hypothetical protein